MNPIDKHKGLKMKKIAIAAAVSAMLLSLPANAQMMEKDLMIGASSVTVGDESGMLYNFAFVGSKTFDSNLYAGLGIAAGFGEIDVATANVTTKENLLEYGLDVRLGYSFGDLDAYGIVGYDVQYIGTGADGAVGIGYGAGIDYKAMKNLKLTLDYKSYSLSPAVGIANFDYSALGMKLGVTWGNNGLY